MRKTISLEEQALLELNGAAQRLAIARQAIADFVSEHGDGDAVSTELRESLERERAMLETELDAARRQHTHCVDEYRRCKTFSALR